MNSELLLSFLIMIPTWVMLLPIGLCSVVLVAVIIDRSIFFHMNESVLQKTVKPALSHIQSGNVKSARTMLQSRKTTLSRVVERFVETVDDSMRDSFVEDAAHDAISRIERYSGAVSTIATVSPMFGLLGTVTGMMKSFSALSAIDVEAQNMLAYGIAEALVTTATGLVVAIPAVIFYNYMVTKSGFLIKQLEIILNSVHDAVRDDS